MKILLLYFNNIDFSQSLAEQVDVEQIAEQEEKTSTKFEKALH